MFNSFNILDEEHSQGVKAYMTLHEEFELDVFNANIQVKWGRKCK